MSIGCDICGWTTCRCDVLWSTPPAAPAAAVLQSSGDGTHHWIDISENIDVVRRSAERGLRQAEQLYPQTIDIWLHMINEIEALKLAYNPHAAPWIPSTASVADGQEYARLRGSVKTFDDDIPF